MLATSDLRLSLYTDGTFEIRNGGEVYVHLTKEETSAMLDWLDARERENAAISDTRDIVTTDSESKEQLIARVRAILQE
jgi:hypothetical protein